MKTVTILCLAALLLATLFVVPGVAQLPCNNAVGLYVAADATGPPRVTMGYLEPVTVYLVLIRPAQCETGYIPLESINGFELAMRFDPVPDYDLFLTDATYHPQAALIQGRDDINAGVIDFCCGYGVDVPVNGDNVVLVELEFLPAGAPTTEVFLEPLPAPAVPGEMSFCAGCTTGGIIMEPISGDHHLPVFAFQAGAVATEAMSYGSVKALFR
jgi:hypothetical protein